MIEEGKPAPDFELTTDGGETLKLSDLRGKQVVLYFYPKDDTPGCTTQACGIRDVYGAFERAGAVVLGISPDGEASHVKFKEKFGLPFTLLADEGHHVADEYDDGCRVRMQRIGPWLLIEDNGGCGGAGVTFTGLYRRTK